MVRFVWLPGEFVKVEKDGQCVARVCAYRGGRDGKSEGLVWESSRGDARFLDEANAVEFMKRVYVASVMAVS